MEGSEDETSEDNAGLDAAFARKYEGSEPEEESLLARSHTASPERSEKSSWSSRSREAGFDGEEPSFDNCTITSRASLQSSRGRSLRRERSMTSHHRGMRRHEDNSPDDFELDRSSEGDESHRGRVMLGEEGVTDEEDAEETVIETSCDEASFNTSIYSYKETGSSSELSVDPVVWKKFKFLSSILKETQHNLRAMDDLILEHRRVQSHPPVVPEPSHTIHQGLGEGEPKTDEAKLEEILSLLHHLTHTLSSYEQHPLLASAPHVQVFGASLHPDAPPHQQAASSLWPEGSARDANVALHHTSPREALVPPSQSPLPHPRSLASHQPLSPSQDARLSESCEGKSITFSAPASHSSGVFGREGSAYTNNLTHTLHIGPDATPSDTRLLQQPHMESPTRLPSYASPHSPLNNKNVDHVAGSLPSGMEVSRVHKKDIVSQTDPFLLVPRMSEEHPPHHHPLSCQSYQTESHQGQEVLHHPLMKETRSLRKEIDVIMARKQALDTRLHALIAHRAMQRELEAAHLDEPKRRLTPLTKSKSLEDGELRRSKSKHGKYKARSKSYEEESYLKKKINSQETYLSMINENQDEFPSLTMASLENDDKITELQTDEADIPGLGDSGLSSEINSINATIQELVKENQQLHKFLQGMTSESLIKVDQEKLALEAKLQSLDKENQSLKICLDENQDSDHVKTKAPKGVKFCINEDNEQVKDSNRETNEMRNNKSKQREDHDKYSEAPTLSPKTDCITLNNEEMDSELVVSTVSEAMEEASQFSSQQQDAIDSLKGEIERLTKQNQQLVNIIEKERHVVSNQKDSPRPMKSQTTNEDVSVSSISENLTDHTNTMKEIDKLQQKVKKLTEERKMLEFKLSNEASERDFESTRLEARIQILTDLNQTLTQKLQDNTHQSKARKAEMCCQTDTLDSKPDATITGRDADKGRDHTTTASHRMSDLSDKLAPTTVNKTSPRPISSITSKKTEEYHDKSNGKFTFTPVAEESLNFRPHLKDFPLSILSSDENISTDDDKMSLIKTPREDTQSSQQSEPCSSSGDAPLISEASGRRGSGSVVSMENMICKREDYSTHGKPSQVQQLEALVAQNKVIANSLSELKSLSKTSENNRESTFIRIMEENVRVMQNIGEKLASAAQPPTSVEPDARLTKLYQDNQDLKSSLHQQQKRIETLINQNSSLEKKLHVAHRKNEEEHEETEATEGSSGSDIPPILEDETMDVKVKTGHKVSKKVSGDTTMNSLSNGKLTEGIERRQSSKPSSTSPPLPLVSADHVRTTSLSPDQAQGSGSHQEHTSQHDGSCDGNQTPSPHTEKRKRSIEVLDPESQRLLDAALRKEKENRTRLLREAETEKEALQDRIVTLVQENDCLAARLQEVVNVSKNLSGHMNSVKDQLERVEAEKDNLHKKVKSLEDGREDSSLSLSDSIGSSRLTHRLKERVRSLQDEVERGWQVAHQHTVERDKAVAEKESLDYTSSIAINTARREADSLREQMASLQEEKDRRWLEQTNLQNELERKSVLAKAAQDSQATHLERLVEAETKIENLHNTLKKVEEQLLKETQARKSAEAEVREMKAKKSVSSPHEDEGEKTASGGEQNWTNTVNHLRNQLHQEQLRARLLEAGEQESNAQVLILQRNVRDALEANQQLQDKHNQLRAAYRVKRAEKTNHRELSQLYTSQVKELGKTSAALEDNFKAMLCGLGENIEVTVELLASHVFLTPCLIHPSPALHQDPEAWFGAQQGRLRWLQSQLRKLCLHNWKTGNLPRTSNLDSSHFDLSFKDQQHSPVAAKFHVKDEVEQRQILKSCRIQHSGVKMDMLSELSILDESRSYTSTPVRRRSSASDISSSAASSPNKIVGETKHSTPKLKVDLTPASGSCVPRVSLSPSVRHGSVYLNEAERILTSQQKELSEAKYRQYKALIHSLQQDLDKSIAPSPSIPSSLFTTPERKVVKPSQNIVEENDQDSLDSEVFLMEVHCSYASSPASASPTLAESSTSTQSLSGNSVKDMLSTSKKSQASQNSLKEKSNFEDDNNSEKSPKEHKDTIDTKRSSRSSSRSSVIKSPKEGRKDEGEQVTSTLKEDQQSCGQDVDKDRDSWEAEDDLIRMLVHSEVVDSHR